MTQAAAKNPPTTDYGLRHEILSLMETLAQSVSTMAPTTTPAATISLVCALAGNGTWLAYALATAAVLLVALCIGRYARYSASPGSLYAYASMTLPPWLSATVAWILLLAYVATGSSVIGGFYHYANLLLHDVTGHVYSTVLLATLVTGVSIWIPYRDVKISARLMLWIEATSVTVIVIVAALLLVRHGLHWDGEQVHLHGMTGSGVAAGTGARAISLRATLPPCNPGFAGSLYVCPTLGGLGITNKTIGPPRQIQLSLSLTF